MHQYPAMGVVSARRCMVLVFGIALMACSQRQAPAATKAPASTRDEAEEVRPPAYEEDASAVASESDAGAPKGEPRDAGHRDGAMTSMPADADVDAELPDAQSGPDSGAGSDGGSCAFTRLGAAVVEHACLHADHGPFVSVMSARDAEAAPSINSLHTAYQVGSEAQGDRVVRYEPRHAGQYAVFVDGGVLRSLTLDSSDPSPLFSGETSCASLARVAVFELSGGVAYALTLEPNDEAPVLVVIEGLKAFGNEAWDGSCACLSDAEFCNTAADCCSETCREGRCQPPAEPVCRSFGPCSTDEECCDYCHDYDHCH